MNSKNKLSAETLGQIALIQSMVVHLPDKKKILTFVAKGLKDLPGVGKVEFRIYEKERETEKKKPELKQELSHRFVLKFEEYEHGELLIFLTEPELFSPYVPFIENLANMLSVIFEERRQRALNKSLVEDLEKGIYLRTKELEIEIEERKQGELEIKMFADALKSISESVTITDLENNLVYVNQSFLLTYGYSEKELLGKNINLVNSPKNPRELLDNISSSTRKGGWHGELWNKRKDGNEFLIDLSTTIIYNKDSKPIGLIGIASDITERKRAEQEIIYQRNNFEQLFINSPAAIAIMDQNDAIIQINEAFTNLFGFMADEAVGRDLSVTVVPNELIEEGRALSRKVHEGVAISQESFRKRKDGSLVFVQIVGIPIVIDSKRIGIYAMYVDLTKRKNAEKALLDSEEKFRQITENIKEVFWLGSPDWSKIYYVSPTFLHLWGITPEALYQNPSLWTESIVEEDKEKVLASIPRNISRETGQILFPDYQIKRPDGSIIWISARAFPVFDQNGIPFRIAGIAEDITERKRAEEDLKKSETKYRTLFNNIADPVFIYDKKTHLFLDCNQAALDFYGYTIEEFRTMTPLQLHPPEELERVIKNLDEKEHDNHSYTHITKDGKKIFVDINSAEIVYQGREGWICTIRDATMRKKAEKIIIESQRLGAIGEMSSAVAHDFNNSLQSIFGNLELAMLNPDIPDRVRKYLEIIKSSTRDAATRVQMLQRFGGRRQAGINYNLLSLNDVVKDVVVQSRPLWKDSLEKEGRIILIKTSFGKIPAIMGNDGELRAVLFNIVKNSIEAMPDGGSIYIETGKKEEGVYLTITDTGIGMDEETKSRVFQPFFSTKGFEIGRGLGMSGAYSVILEHEGKIFVSKSAPGEGTTLEIILPYAPKDEIKKVDEKESPYEGSASVLWVEDDKMIREIATEMLECLGHTGDVVASGLEALEFLDQKRYDLVITDIGMPGMSGWQLADKIKVKFKGKMKVAVLTGWGAQIDDNKKNEHGVGYILGKPFHISQLEKLIGEALQVDPD